MSTPGLFTPIIGAPAGPMAGPQPAAPPPAAPARTPEQVRAAAQAFAGGESALANYLATFPQAEPPTTTATNNMSFLDSLTGYAGDLADVYSTIRGADQSPAKPLPAPKPKSNTGLFIGIGAAVLVVIVLVFALKK